MILVIFTVLLSGGIAAWMHDNVWNSDSIYIEDSMIEDDKWVIQSQQENYKNFWIKMQNEVPQITDKKKTYTNQEIYEALESGLLDIDDFDEGCLFIKWNVSHKTGSKIYHMPGGEFYDKTLIRDDEGDQLFCTEREAQAAGFRKSKQ